jgi:hypothetical protein
MWTTLARRRPVRLAALGALAAILLLLAWRALGSRGGDARFDVQLVPLRDPSRREAAGGAAPVARAAKPILFSITIPSHFGGARLETRILDAKGDLVWVGVGLLRHESLGSGQLYLPAGFLRPGEYRLAVGRAQPGADRAEFSFRLE